MMYVSVSPVAVAQQPAPAVAAEQQPPPSQRSGQHQQHLSRTMDEWGGSAVFRSLRHFEPAVATLSSHTSHRAIATPASSSHSPPQRAFGGGHLQRLARKPTWPLVSSSQLCEAQSHFLDRSPLSTTKRRPKIFAKIRTKAAQLVGRHLQSRSWSNYPCGLLCCTYFCYVARSWSNYPCELSNYPCGQRFCTPNSSNHQGPCPHS
jgi:hypothetical protein